MATTGIVVNTTPKNIVDELSLSSGDRRVLQNVGTCEIMIAEAVDAPEVEDFWGIIAPLGKDGRTVNATEGIWVRTYLKESRLAVDVEQ